MICFSFLQSTYWTCCFLLPCSGSSSQFHMLWTLYLLWKYLSGFPDFFSFGPSPFYSDSIDVSLYCKGICFSSSIVFNIFIRLSIISSPLSFSHSAFHLDLSPDSLLFTLRIAFFHLQLCYFFTFNLRFIINDFFSFDPSPFYSDSIDVSLYC